MARRESGSGERGAVLPLIAIMIAAVTTFAALAVDLGNVTNERRQDQSAADSAALAAAQEMEVAATAAATALDFANRNVDVPFTAAEFSTCTDPPPSGFTPVGADGCVSIDTSGTQVRVELPIRSADAVFGAVVGIDNFDHSATSVAAIVSLGYGNVLPLGLANGASGNVCLKAGAGNVPDDDCNTPTSGNFGFINFGFYGNVLLGTAVDCTGGGKSGRLANNIAAGLDHEISLLGGSPHGNTPTPDSVGNTCGATYPNGTDTVTGNVPRAFGLGLAFGDSTLFSDGDPARLQRGGADWGSGAAKASVAGFSLDDVALYEYIGNLAGANVPNSCHRGQFVGADNTLGTGDDLDLLPDAIALHVSSIADADRVSKLMDRCITHYDGLEWDDDGSYQDTSVSPATGELPVGCVGACSDPVFNRNSAIDAENDLYDIQYSPRFAYVPELDTADPNGVTDVSFIDIQPIFIQRIYAGSCNTSGCEIIYDPGVGYSSGASTDKVNAMRTFVLPDASLPNGLGDPGAAYDISKNRFIQLVG
ncbi:MAG: pilus assembly protein TadG-related protein [Acidimicrobiia bacterium]|nr:pilus assembly protein TadG-related protein [Acidimicrobiia bacterium]